MRLIRWTTVRKTLVETFSCHLCHCIFDKKYIIQTLPFPIQISIQRFLLQVVVLFPSTEIFGPLCHLGFIEGWVGLLLFNYPIEGDCTSMVETSQNHHRTYQFWRCLLSFSWCYIEALTCKLLYFIIRFIQIKKILKI